MMKQFSCSHATPKTFVQAPVSARHEARLSVVPPTKALPFGFGREKKIIDDEKERMWEAQQELLKARREGRGLDGVTERRAAAKKKFTDIEAKKRKDRAALARGEKLEEDEKYEPYGKEDAGLQGGILIPLAPFGIPKFDNGERFDLKAPYTDVGWVDDEADPFKWAKNLFGGKKEAPKEDENESKGKGKSK